MEKINIAEKFAKFSDLWSPKIIAELNDSYIKLAKLQGEFIWHKHNHEDEFFYCIEGQLTILLLDNKKVLLNPGEMFVVPKGVQHKPIAQKLTSVMIIEPKTTINTGQVTDSDKNS